MPSAAWPGTGTEHMVLPRSRQKKSPAARTPGSSPGAGAAEPGAQIQHIEIAPRRQGGTGAAAVPIRDEIERFRARFVGARRLAGDGDGGGQAALLVRVRSGILGEEC